MSAGAENTEINQMLGKYCSFISLSIDQIYKSDQSKKCKEKS